MHRPTARMGRLSRAMNGLLMGGLMGGLLAALSACGGGGGGAPNDAKPSQVDALNQADGLGDRGELPGTVVVGDVRQLNGLSPDVGQASAVSLGDDGSALMVWKATSATSATANGLNWSRSASGTSGWQAAKALTQAKMGIYDVHLQLKRNAGGDMVLGWWDSSAVPLFTAVPGALLRWDGATKAWEAQSPDTSAALLNWPHQDGGALHLLNDGTVLSDAQSVVAGGGTVVLAASAKVAPQPAYDNTMLAKAFAPFGPNSGTGLTVAVVNSPILGGTQRVAVRVETPQTGAVNPSTLLPLLSDVKVCTDVGGNNGVQVVASSARSAAIAVWVSTFLGTCAAPDLVLVHAKVDNDDKTFTFQSSYVANITTAPRRSPRLAIDAQGRALVVWCRGLLAGTQYAGVSPAGCFWTRGQSDQAWSAPATLIPNIDDLGAYALDWAPSLAMNANGQAVVALLIDGKPSNRVNELLMVGRFSFDAGWQPWVKAANKYALKGYAVAINGAGQALLGYSALDAMRTGGLAPIGYGYSGGPDNAPWMRAFASRL
jgi:hypothetical protein